MCDMKRVAFMYRFVIVLSSIALLLVSCGKNNPDEGKTLTDAWWVSKPGVLMGELHLNLDGKGHFTLDRILNEESMAYQLDPQIQPFSTYSGTYTIKDGKIIFEDKILFGNVAVTEEYAEGNFDGLVGGYFFKLVDGDWNGDEPTTYAECKNSCIFYTYCGIEVVNGKEKTGEGYGDFGLYTGPRNPLAN